ncbi:efflux transporter outer membrane subunit [Sphingomonas sp. IC4-52]|uniref:efflux transporter outer membrane subunit n=1 Tax=Sphingomonas sp. IC4-52 TaxID=2887202 RepID=UPI001D112AB6|nr:efflux transporter outer membrane subunit [Sphingomonas sp. IC4-52]MCC2981076.1 efflux transporter outer membrane subunit [Sphingomonas sp. IC4-52]
MRQLTITALMAGTLLAGCTAPNPPRPEAAAVAAPVAWRTNLPAGAALEADWWGRFGDPALGRLVERARANNPDVAIAAARVQEARANERLARAQLFPSLDVGAGVSEARAVNPLGVPTTNTGFQPLFQAAYEIDLFGRIGNQVEAARQSTAASEAARDTALLSVTAATASGYITLRALDARREVVQATIASRAEALRLARSRAEVGYTSQLELRQAEAEYRATTQILPQVDLAIRRQENALSILTGVAPQQIERGTPLSSLQAPPVPAGLPADLLRRRPDIAQAEYTLAATDASLAAARAQFLPSLRLTGSTGLTLSTALSDPVSIWAIGASVLAPLFQGGRLRANVEGAAARRDQAAFSYQRTALTAFREVEDNLAAVDRLAAQRRELEAQRTATAEALRHAANRYRAGYAAYLEQLDAQRALLNVELTLVQLRADQLNSLVALYQAMGGGWSRP